MRWTAAHSVVFDVTRSGTPLSFNHFPPRRDWRWYDVKIYKKNKYDGRDRFSFPLQSMRREDEEPFSFKLTEELHWLWFYASLRFVSEGRSFLLHEYAMILLYVRTLPSLPRIGGNSLWFILPWIGIFFSTLHFKARREKHNHAKIHTFHPSRPPRYLAFLIIEPSIPSPFTKQLHSRWNCTRLSRWYWRQNVYVTILLDERSKKDEASRLRHTGE